MARRKHEEPENHERWLVSYADFITLLFAFFVVLYATSNRNEEKERDFQESIKKFMSLVGGAGGASGSSVGISSGNVIDVPEAAKPRQAQNSEIEKEVSKFLNQKINPEKMKAWISDIRSDQKGIRIVLPSGSVFSASSAKLKPTALPIMADLAELLNKVPYRVIIEGHTDNVPIQDGHFESNWELAGGRASALLRYLVKVHGVDAKKISVASFADQKPLVANDTQANRDRNSRVEIVILTKEESDN